MVKKIIIQKINRPSKKNLSSEIRWVCESLGLVSGRDTSSTSFKVIKKLLEISPREKAVSTKKLSKALKIECPTINHHVRSIMNQGILTREKKKIVFQGGSLSAAIDLMKLEADKMFSQIKEVAEEIDKKLGYY